MSESKIVLHHVGGRWGNLAFALPSCFEQDFVNVLYEADTDAIDGIYEAHRGKKSKLIVIPLCLADANGPKTLRLTLNPGATSLLPPGPGYDDRYDHVEGIDFDYPDSVQVIEERAVEARTLDSLLQTKPDLPSPDFLSLDTQGPSTTSL